MADPLLMGFRETAPVSRGTVKDGSAYPLVIYHLPGATEPYQVYDRERGRLLGTFHTLAEAREHRNNLLGRNPAKLLFRTRAAAVKYAREHGAKKFSIKKLKRGSA